MSSRKANPAKGVLIPVLLFSLILVVYNIVRIINVPFTHDECITPGLMQSYRDYISMKQVSINNHILNSISRKFFIELFNSYSPLVIRLPSLLALIIYMLFSYLILKRLFTKNAWLLAGFILLNLNPFMFDFWGLSRGYGLGIAFMMAGIYFLVSYFLLKKQQHLWLYLIMAILAILANFSLLNFYVASIVVLIAAHVLFYSKNKIGLFFKRELPVIAAMSLVLYLLIGASLAKLRAADEFCYGGDTGIVNDTVYSLVRETFNFQRDSPYIAYTSWLIVISILAISFYWLITFFRGRNKDSIQMGIILWLLFIVPLLSIYMQHILLGTKYLVDRTALFLLVLYKLQLIFTLYNLAGNNKMPARVFVALITALSLINFIRNMNTNHAQTWWYGRKDKTVIDIILKESAGRQDKIKIRTTWLFAPSFIYYRENMYKDRFDAIEYIKDRPGSDTTYDYYYLAKEDTVGISDKYMVDTSFFDGWAILLKKRR